MALTQPLATDFWLSAHDPPDRSPAFGIVLGVLSLAVPLPLFLIAENGPRTADPRNGNLQLVSIREGNTGVSVDAMPRYLTEQGTRPYSPLPEGTLGGTGSAAPQRRVHPGDTAADFAEVCGAAPSTFR